MIDNEDYNVRLARYIWAILTSQHPIPAQLRTCSIREERWKLGRKTGTIKSEDKKREEYKEVISLLKRGYSIRNTAKITGYSFSTVQRIKNHFFK